MKCACIVCLAWFNSSNMNSGLIVQNLEQRTIRGGVTRHNGLVLPINVQGLVSHKILNVVVLHRKDWSN